MAFRGLGQRRGDRGGEVVVGREQDDPSESAPSEDTTSICNRQVRAAMLRAGRIFTDAASHPQPDNRGLRTKVNILDPLLLN